jgi:hypothetical protein
MLQSDRALGTLPESLSQLLHGARLARLDGANLAGANLSTEATLCGANLNGAIFGVVKMMECRNVNGEP